MKFTYQIILNKSNIQLFNIPIDNKLSALQIIQKYKKNYTIYKLNKYNCNKILQHKYFNTDKLFLQLLLTEKRGLPDFFIYKNKHEFLFIEVKLHQDTFSSYQFKWLLHFEKLKRKFKIKKFLFELWNLSANYKMSEI